MIKNGLAALTDDDLRDVGTGLWFDSQSHRRDIHRLCQTRRCDLGVVVVGHRFGNCSTVAPDTHPMLLVTGECLCVEYMIDLFVAADRFLATHATTLHNPPGAVRVHLRRREPGDWTRRRRVAMGAQARPERMRSSVRGRALPDDFHRALLEYVVDEAGSLAPLEDDAQLHRRLTELAAAEFGGCPADYTDRVAVGLRVIEAACRSGHRVRAPGEYEDMTTWWERYVERPLGRRARLSDGSVDDLVDLTAAAGSPVSDRGVTAAPIGTRHRVPCRSHGVAPSVTASA